MNRNIIIGGGVAAAVVAAGIGIAVAGSGGHGYSSGNSSKTTQAQGTGTVAAVQTAQTSLGQILVDSRGRTLYLFEKDPTNMSTCNGSCTSIWPPLMTSGAPNAVNGAQSSLLGAVSRSSGAQVTYAGHPLYFYVGDDQAGAVRGQGLNQFGAVWEAVSPSGQGVDSK
jgi:predicted lipoprotein with Yx(FWY)xxD motif